MRKSKISLPARKSRDGVVRALLAKLGVGAGRRPVQAQHTKSSEPPDLAQRVRECGEW